jgi:hypothetical protein
MPLIAWPARQPWFDPASGVTEGSFEGTIAAGN